MLPWFLVSGLLAFSSPLNLSALYRGTLYRRERKLEQRCFARQKARRPGKGAGRQKAGDAIDFAVGISGIKKIGEHVDLDEPLMFVHARTERSLDSVLPLLEKAVRD